MPKPVVLFLLLILFATADGHADPACLHHKCEQLKPLWQFNVGGPAPAAPVHIGGTVYVAGNNTLFALTPAGKARWSYDAGAYIAAAVTPANSKESPLILLHADNGLHALNDAGEKVWFYASDDHSPIVEGKSWGWGDGKFEDPWGWYRSSATVKGNIAYMGSGDGVHAIKLDSGERLWHASIGTVSTTPAIHHDLIIAGSWDDHVYALDSQSGEIVWRFAATPLEKAAADWIGYQGFHLSPTVHEGRVYLGSRGMYFYALEAASGKEAWSAKDPSSWIGSQATTYGGSVLYGLSDGNAVERRNLKTGELLARYDTKAYVYARPGIYKNYLIAGSMAGELLAIDLQADEIRRIFQTPPSRKNYTRLMKPEGGMKPLENNPAVSQYELQQKYIDTKFGQLGALLGMTLHKNIAYVTTGYGDVYAFDLDEIEKSVP